MAHDAAELFDVVRNHGVSAERLLSHVGQAGFIQSDVASLAAVHDTEFGMPDLLNSALEVPPQGDSFAAAANHAEVRLLIMAPFAEMMFRRGDGERQQEDDADHAERAHRIAR